jgi:hypothetical protein
MIGIVSEKAIHLTSICTHEIQILHMWYKKNSFKKLQTKRHDTAKRGKFPEMDENQFLHYHIKSTLINTYRDSAIKETSVDLD